MSKCIHCFVSGRVQGVFFRAATQRKAVDLGLSGWVRNRPDGRVEVLACGPESAVDALQRWLREGPTHARVEDVTCSPGEPPEGEGFEVR